MNFGNIFRYNYQFYDGEIQVWRVLANSRDEADTKLNNFVNLCASTHMNVPVHIEYVSQEDDPILY